jgi:hypothetical protein
VARAQRARNGVYAVSIVNRGADKGGPYNVVLVDLAEGPRLMGRVDGVANEAVRIGMAVKARVGKGAAGEPCVVFDIDAAAGGAEGAR